MSGWLWGLECRVEMTWGPNVNLLTNTFNYYALIFSLSYPCTVLLHFVFISFTVNILQMGEKQCSASFQLFLYFNFFLALKETAWKTVNNFCENGSGLWCPLCMLQLAHVHQGACRAFICSWNYIFRTCSQWRKKEKTYLHLKADLFKLQFQIFFIKPCYLHWNCKITTHKTNSSSCTTHWS